MTFADLLEALFPIIRRKWISCVILAPDQLQDYLPDVKIHVL